MRSEKRNKNFRISRRLKTEARAELFNDSSIGSRRLISYCNKWGMHSVVFVFFLAGDWKRHQMWIEQISWSPTRSGAVPDNWHVVGEKEKKKGSERGLQGCPLFQVKAAARTPRNAPQISGGFGLGSPNFTGFPALPFLLERAFILIHLAFMLYAP